MLPMWVLSEQSWRLSTNGSLEPRRSVGSTDSNRIETHCKSSKKGTPTPTSDDACSGSQVHQSNNQRWRAKACKTLSSEDCWENFRQLVFSSNTKNKTHSVEYLDTFILQWFLLFRMTNH